METFRFWCQKVLPLVYDNSLSYYEVLCKVVEYINNLIETDKMVISDVSKLKSEVNSIQNAIDIFDRNVIEKVIEEYIATSVFFNITDNGRFVAYIPETWKDIDFNTTGLDINLNIEPEFGHLVLSY